MEDSIVSSVKITDDTITSDDLSSILRFKDGDYLDLSTIIPTGNDMGLKLPQSNDCSKITDEGLTCWDRDDNVLTIGTGDNRSQFYGFGPAIDSAEITNGTVSFDDLANDAALDATTTWTLGTSNFILNLSSTGDFIIQDNGTAFATFADDGSVTLANDLTISGNDLIFGNSERIVNTTDGSIGFTDGTNTLLSIVDQGSYGTLRLVDKGSTGDPSTCTAGDLYFNQTDATFKGCSASNTWEVLDNASSSGGTTILKRVSAAQSATTCATSDTNLTGGTYTLPAGQLSTNKGLRIYAVVTTTAVGTADQLKLLVDFGGTNIQADGTLPLPFTSRGTAPLDAVIYNRDSASSQFASIEVGRPGGSSPTTGSTTASVDTGSAVTVVVQCADYNSGTGGDDDTATLEMLIIEELGSGS